jgi:asparagine synthase (glutamine-hydrolysing)
LAHPDFPAEVDQEGLNEIFIVGPARTPGCGVFRNMAEMKPGYCLILDRNGAKMVQYWSLKSRPHTDDVETTASRIYQLLEDTVRRQLISDVPVCTLLSGGLDSSALTALTVKHFREQGKAVDSYSIDYKDNDKYFTASDFTPNADSQWIGKVSDFLQTRHHYIEIDTPELARALTEAVEAKDLPGMADVDSSLLLFCREIKKDATVAISGEAADEVFGGYPWLYRQESLEAATFPWSLRADSRIGVLSPELADWLKPKQYLDERYREALDEVPRLKGENGREARMREMSYLNITRFMPTLLDRKDRMSMRVGLEARVPFCDHRLVEYVWNIPWEMKTAGGREKGILRMALQNILPEDVVYRKKSPYPKTHNPNYMTAVRGQLLEILNDPASPLVPLVNAEKLKQWAASDQDHFDIPWFGQLMKGPQLFAYLIQVDTWLRKYRISIV